MAEQHIMTCGNVHFGAREGSPVLRTRDGLAKFGAMATDLGHHWARPTYEGETKHGPCDYLHGADCFYDGSGLNAGPVLDRFLREGCTTPSALTAPLGGRPSR